MTNVFKDEKTLGAELVRFHRSHTGQPIEKFFKFILAPHLLPLVKETCAAGMAAALDADRLTKSMKESNKKVEKKGKGK